MANELLITINANAKNAQKAFDDMQKGTEDLEKTLNKVALVSAAAFAAFSAEIYFSVKAFEEANVAAVELTNALQNQGIYTKQLTEDYKSYAEAVQAATGLDDDAISKAQAIAQTYLGQTKITERLTFAIADLSAAMGGDLNGAAEKIARTIGTSTNAFVRQGLVLDQTSTTAERYQKVLEYVELKSGGLATEFNKADGYAKALVTSFGNLQEEIGSRFAPVISAVRESAVKFFDALRNNPLLVDLGVALLAAGTAMAGLIAGVTALVPVFLTATYVAAAFGTTVNVAFAGIPAAIGAVVAALTLLALNWDASLRNIKIISTAAVNYLTDLFFGLGKVLTGAFELDIDQIKSGLDQITGAYTKAFDSAAETYYKETTAKKENLDEQNKAKKDAADKEAAIERQHQLNLRAIRTAEIDLLKLQNANASQTLIDLKSKEIDILKALDQKKSQEELAQLRERHEKIIALQTDQESQDLTRFVEFEKIKEDTRQELAQKGIEVNGQLRDAEIAAIVAQAKTTDDIDRDLQTTILTRRITARNQELLDRKKYGETAAKINYTLNTEEVQGAKTAADGLVELTRSKNAELKEIGKIASITQIAITTPEAAMKAYDALVGIPFVGPALATVAAAATIAYGAERIAEVTALADGGIVTGGTAGKDSVPAMLMPGELVVPKRNFNDVVGAIKNQSEGGGSPEMLQILRSIDNKFSQPSQTIIHGDVTSDDSYINSLVKRISDAIEFRNGKIYGVNI